MSIDDKALSLNQTTQRQKAYLERLRVRKGRRVVVDFDVGLAEGLDQLVESGYGRSQVEVVRRALSEAIASQRVVCADKCEPGVESREALP